MSEHIGSERNGCVYWIHALSPLHVGSGRGVGFVDLPIMREKITGWPMVPGSSVKGVWLDYAECRGVELALRQAAFGRAEDSAEDDHAGSFAITDARIVLLPARSLYGTFAYLTSSLVLKRLARDLSAIGLQSVPEKIPQNHDQSKILVTSESVLSVDGKVYLEDLDFSARDGSDTGEVDRWAHFLAEAVFEGEYRQIFRQRFALVPDSAFDFLCQQGTQIDARVRIDDSKKKVADGALWYEESLPAETVLAGVVFCERSYGIDLSADELLDKFCKDPFTCQMGGKATTGKGRVRCVFTWERRG